MESYDLLGGTARPSRRPQGRSVMVGDEWVKQLVQCEQISMLQPSRELLCKETEFATIAKLDGEATVRRDNLPGADKPLPIAMWRAGSLLPLSLRASPCKPSRWVAFAHPSYLAPWLRLGAALRARLVRLISLAPLLPFSLGSLCVEALPFDSPLSMPFSD